MVDSVGDGLLGAQEDTQRAGTGVQVHWQVVNRTYPGGERSDGTRTPETVTEFQFGNGVTIQYDPRVGGLYVYLPVQEAVMSVRRSTDCVRNDDRILVNVDRINGQAVGIEVIEKRA